MTCIIILINMVKTGADFMYYIYRSKGDNPFRNLAIEELLCSAAAERGRPVLYLWQNDGCVVIGKNQNPWAECDLTAMENAGVRLVRRKTGGGAVYHDMGNLNYSFCMPRDMYDTQKQYGVILSALRGLGVDAELTGRNDITVESRKVSGSAFMHTAGASLHHGTLLICSDLSVFSKYLTPPPDKLSSKGIKSVSSRVTNLAAYKKELSPETVADAVAYEFERAYGKCEELTEPLGERTEKLFGEYASWDFRFGYTPPFETTVEGRLPFGKLTIGLSLEKGLIKDCRVWSDMLNPDFPGMLEAELISARFEKNELACAAKRVGIEPEASLTAQWLSGCAI